MPNTVPAAATGLPAASLKLATSNGAPTGAIPTAASGRVLWAKAAMLQAAKLWAGALAIRSDASAEAVAVTERPAKFVILRRLGDTPTETTPRSPRAAA